MTRPCETCLYGKSVPDRETRCFRPRTMKDGRIVEAVNPGWMWKLERDSIPEPQRADGDKCGPLGAHWVAMP